MGLGRGAQEDGAKIGVIRPQAKGCQGWLEPLEAGGEARGRFLPLGASRRNRPCDTLIRDFWPPEQGENESLLFKPLCLWSFVTTVPPRSSYISYQKERDWWRTYE